MEDQDKTKEELIGELSALREQVKEIDYFKTTLKNSPIVIFNQDLNLKYTWIYNPNKGFDPNTVLGKTETDMLPSEEASHLTEIKNRVLETGVGIRETVSATIQEKKHYYDLTVVPLFNEQGEKVGITCATTDISKLKESEIALQAAYHELEEIDHAKDKFFSIIAHDLRSPLASVSQFAEILSEGIADFSREDIHTFAVQLNKKVHKLYDLLENLLKWAKVQIGHLQPHPEEIQPAQVTEDIQLLFQDDLYKKQITFVNQLDPEIVVMADANMFASILQNLVSNAIKFTLIGGTISIFAHPTQDMVAVSVQDTGIGMTRGTVENLFKIEGNLSRSGTLGETGSGLGLILCKEFVKKNGGEIWVESQEEKGSTFTFTLPRAFKSP